MNKYRIGMMLAAAGFCLAASADGVTLRMDFYYGTIKAAEVQEVFNLSADGKTYEIESKGTAVGLAKVLYGDTWSYSSGYTDETHGLLMTVYAEQRGKRKPQRAELNGEQLLLQRGDEQRSETVAAPLFDYLSLVYRSYVLGEPTGGRFKFTNGWRLTDYDYELSGSETIQSDLGELETVLLIRRSERGERKIWLAPQLDYLPVRLYVNDKGHEFTTILRSVEK